MILTRFGCEDCSRLIRSHSGSRIRGVILDLPIMAAGGAAGSVSREPVALRRSDRAPLYNEKEYFYRKRVLRRMQKVAGSACRPVLPGLKEQTEEVAALVARCSLLEWSAAVSQYNVSNLEERLRRLEAATELPPLPLPAAVPKTYDIAPPCAPTAGAAAARPSAGLSCTSSVRGMLREIEYIARLFEGDLARIRPYCQVGRCTAPAKRASFTATMFK